MHISAGYYCPSGAEISTFLQCPAGAYCPEGTDIPLLCAPGTFSSTPGLMAATDCTNCTGGFYCPTSGQSNIWPLNK